MRWNIAIVYLLKTMSLIAKVEIKNVIEKLIFKFEQLKLYFSQFRNSYGLWLFKNRDHGCHVQIHLLLRSVGL